MALKYGEATFEILPAQEGNPVQLEMSREIPERKFGAPTFATPAQVQDCFLSVPSCSVEYNSEMQMWVPMHTQKTGHSTAPSRLLSGNRFEETHEGLYAVRAGSRKQLLTNATISIASVTEHWIGDTSCEVYHCFLRCHEAWGNEERAIDIPKEKFKSAYRLIHTKYPEVSLSAQDIDAIDAYLTKVAQRDLAELPRKIESSLMGWLETNDTTSYHIGTDAFYREHQFPDVSNEDRRQIFMDALAFCDIGHGNDEIETIWLFAHTPYDLFWFRKASQDLLRSVLFIKGASNLWKSSVIRIIADVFRTDRLRASMPLSSTQAAIQDYLVHLRDSLACLDDYSNTAGAKNVEMVRNAETVIRAVGDGAFSGKMSVTDFSKIRSDKVRCQVVITGEDALGLDSSSLYRLIVVQVIEGTIDPAVLKHFQDNPLVMSHYFALFLRFIKEFGNKISQHVREMIESYREIYRNALEIPRYVDAAVGFHLQADIIVAFARYCGVDNDASSSYHARACAAMLRILKKNQDTSREAKPTLRFVNAFLQSVGTSKTNGIAPDEQTYVQNEASYIGFEEKESRSIWVRFEAAIALVRLYYERQGTPWLTKDTTIKEQLLREGISVGKLAGKGKCGNEFLCRARKGSRKRMLVLKKDIMEKMFNESTEGERNGNI